MFFCEQCGQCRHISEEKFGEMCYTRGTAIQYINPEDGEVDDYGDSDTTDTDHDYYYCLHCDGSDINSNWNGTEEEARATRSQYEAGLIVQEEERKLAGIKESLKNADWDHTENLK